MFFQRLRKGARLFAFFSIALLSFAGDKDNKQDNNNQNNDDSNGSEGKVSLSRLVVIGDSLSAGFQNFSLFNAPNGGQTHGFAALIAAQAGVKLTLPLISPPGLPPALGLTPQGMIVRPPVAPGVRTNVTEQATDLSVPGFTLADALARPFPGSPATNLIDVLSLTVQAYPTLAGQPQVPGCGPIPIGPGAFVLSEVACAVALKPTTVLVSIGNNDALQSLTFGLPPTDPSLFRGQLLGLLAPLALTKAQIVISNIPDVSAIPFLLPYPAFFHLCGFAPVGATPADFVVPDVTNPTLTTLNVCLNYQVRKGALIAQTQAAITAYNQIIQQTANQFGALVVDVNGLFSHIAQKGYTVGGVKLTTAFLGGIFSLDGIHPTNTGYAILANEFIKTMNSEINTSIPPISVEQVAKVDPLVFKKP